MVMTMEEVKVLWVQVMVTSLNHATKAQHLYDLHRMVVRGDGGSYGYAKVLE